MAIHRPCLENRMKDPGHYEQLSVHFDDLDPMGVLHNSRYAALVERAIHAHWLRLGWAPDAAVSAFPDVLVAVREVRTTFHRPITGVCAPVVHFWIERMGRTSCVHGYRILSPDRSAVHAEGHRAIVNLDPGTGRPAPFSDGLRVAEGLSPQVAGSATP
ncbi:acyl-CoA thioesterase [Kitasatospora sp. NPDC058397]|uniref:acyl-CoA thioesterase n=2 Tax=Kitasatospora TaxID=2063 RepID=UPI003657711A